MLKRLIILIVFFQLFSLTGNCDEVNAVIFSKSDVSKTIEHLNENENVLLNVRRLEGRKKLFTCNFNITKDTIDTIYNYLISHNLNIDYFNKCVDNVMSVSLNKIIEEIYSNEGVDTDEKVSQSNFFMQEFGIYDDLPLIKENLVFYIVIWNPDYHVVKQFDIAFDKDLNSIILSDIVALNTLIINNKITIQKDDIKDLLKLFIKMRAYIKIVSIDREVLLLNEKDVNKFNNKKMYSSNHKYSQNVQGASSEIHKKFLMCIRSHYSPILIKDDINAFNVVFYSFIEYYDPLGTPLYKLYRYELKININGEIITEEKEEIKCE